jgi:transposase
MGYPDSAWERAMKVQEVMLRAMSGAIHWFHAAEILGLSPRSLRRWRQRYEAHGYDGLLDRRTGRPSPRRAPVEQVERVLRLYRERYQGFNVRHFHQIARREHGVTLSYSFVKLTLQGAGLVKKRRTRGRHRCRRQPRACFGELLHLDGSQHRWLALAPDQRPCLLLVADDATTRVLTGAFVPVESTETVMTQLAGVFRTQGLPLALYTDRASWAFYTPTAKGPVDKIHVTPVGRARLGIEHIPAYSPQARGRSERLNRTFQDRLVNELRVAGITTLAAANRYLLERFLPDYNATFARVPRDPASAFVPLGTVDLDQILCHEEERVVAHDNTVTLGRQVLQLARQPGRRSCAGLRLTVRRHLDATYSVWRGTQCWGRYHPGGQPVDADASVDARRERRAPTRRLDRRPRTPPAHKRPQPSLSRKRTDHVSNRSGQITC